MAPIPFISRNRESSIRNRDYETSARSHSPVRSSRYHRTSSRHDREDHSPDRLHSNRFRNYSSTSNSLGDSLRARLSQHRRDDHLVESYTRHRTSSPPPPSNHLSSSYSNHSTMRSRRLTNDNDDDDDDFDVDYTETSVGRSRHQSSRDWHIPRSMQLLDKQERDFNLRHSSGISNSFFGPEDPSISRRRGRSPIRRGINDTTSSSSSHGRTRSLTPVATGTRRRIYNKQRRDVIDDDDRPSTHLSSTSRSYDRSASQEQLSDESLTSRDRLSSINSRSQGTSKYMHGPSQSNVVDTYEAHPNVMRRSRTHIEQFLVRRHLTVAAHSSVIVPRPVESFSECGFPARIADVLQAQPFKSPTAIQCQAIPTLLSGMDLFGISPHGGGKTLAYVLPAVARIRMTAAPGEGPSVLVLSATRDSAARVLTEFDRYVANTNLRCTALYGGVARGPQIRALTRGADIVVATPGRLVDMLQSRSTDLSRLSFCILDDADRMLELGFEPQIRSILDRLPTSSNSSTGSIGRRDTLVYSNPRPVQLAVFASLVRNDLDRLVAHYLSNPVTVCVSAVDSEPTQNVIVCTEYDKRALLVDQMRMYLDSKALKSALVFASTKRTADEITRTLRDMKFTAVVLHGDQSPAERDWVLSEFSSGRCPVLVATDVAAKTLLGSTGANALSNVNCIINYDLPSAFADYLQRLGSLSRVSRSLMVSFFTEGDAALSASLYDLLCQTRQEIPAAIRQIAQRRRQGSFD